MATYKIDKITLPNGDVCAIPDASLTDRGLVSTGEQKITGQKFFQHALSIDNEADTSIYPRLYFRDSTYISSSATMGQVTAQLIDNISNITQHKFSIQLVSPKSDGTGYTTKVEAYFLPTVTNGLTDSQTYNIITTKNLTDIPDASITERGLVNITGNQKFAGYKRFVEGVVTIDNENAASSYKYYTELDFRDSKPSTGTRAAYILNRQQSSTSTLENRFYFVLYSPNTAGTSYTSSTETYKLPTVNTNLSSSAEYDILTTKNTKTVTASLTTSGWTASNTQTVTVTGMTASAIIIVSAAPASEAAYRQNGVYCSAQAANSLTFTCASIPTAAITVQILTIG